MSKPWKVLIASLAVYQVVLTWAIVRMSNYNAWLQFDCSRPESECSDWPMLGTVPGRQVFWWLMGVAIALVAINVIAFVRRQPAPEDGASH